MGPLPLVSFRGSPPYWFLKHRLPSEGLFSLFCRVLVNPRLLEDKATVRDLSLPYCEGESRSVMSDSLRPHGLYSPWSSPGQNTGVGSLSLLQGIFPTQGLNPGLLHCGQILYCLSHKRSPRIREWVAYPFSRGSSRPRNQTGVSCIAGRFYTNWAMFSSMY